MLARSIRLGSMPVQRQRGPRHALGEMNAMFTKEGDMIGVGIDHEVVEVRDSPRQGKPRSVGIVPHNP